MNKKKYFEYSFISMYFIVLCVLLIDIIKSGILNIKLYQVLMLGVLIFSFLDRIKTILNNKN
jgi:hypothetical protein